MIWLSDDLILTDLDKEAVFLFQLGGENELARGIAMNPNEVLIHRLQVHFQLAGIKKSRVLQLVVGELVRDGLDSVLSELSADKQAIVRVGKGIGAEGLL